MEVGPGQNRYVGRFLWLLCGGRWEERTLETRRKVGQGFWWGARGRGAYGEEVLCLGQGCWEGLSD